ncbi:MAG: dTMP kinase [Peptococcaceae bacterium]|nr:dTMP kinase [Peptococcaceae bacterium]
MRGRLIVLEGIDGSGKGTQLELLRAKLARAGREVVLTREPSESAVGKLIRQALADASQFDEATMALLFAADRIEHIKAMRADLDAGKIVLCDRYILSSLAYNSQSLPLEWILAINRQADARLHPDLTLLFDLAASDAMARIDARGDAHERYESQRQLTLVRDMYRSLAEVRHDDNVTLIDAAQDPAQIHDAVWQAVQTIL